MANDSAASSILVQTVQLSWNYIQAGLREIDAPSGKVLWTPTGLPAASGTVITIPTANQPTLAANGKLAVMLTFTQMYTTLTSSAASGSKVLQTGSASAFLAGDPVYVTNGTNSDSNVVSSISGTTINLTNGLTHTYASGATVRHRANADDMSIYGMNLTAIYGYQKAQITGHTCTSNLAQVTFQPVPQISNAEQDYPAANTLCSTVTGTNKVSAYFSVPTHIVITDESGKGIAGGNVFYYEDTAFQTVAPTSGYTQLALTYSSSQGTWDGTIPGFHNARIWLYFTALDNEGDTNRSPNSSGAYSYDYVANTTPPSCPTGLTATKGNGNGTINLTWAADTSAPDIASYNVYRKIKGGSFSEIATGVAPNSPTVSYTDTNGLQTNKNCYDYYVTAVDKSGNESTGCSGDIAGAGSGTCP